MPTISMITCIHAHGYIAQRSICLLQCAKSSQVKIDSQIIDTIMLMNDDHNLGTNIMSTKLREKLTPDPWTFRHQTPNLVNSDGHYSCVKYRQFT